MNYILFDGTVRNALLPFTFTRPIADIRIGILTIREKWEKHTGVEVSTWTDNYLSDRFSKKVAKENILINSSVLPDELLLKEINALKAGEKLVADNVLLAINVSEEDIEGVSQAEDVIAKSTKKYSSDILKINNLCDIFLKNEEAINKD